MSPDRTIPSNEEPINLKTLLGKTFRLFVNQKVLGMGVIRGKIPGLFS